MTQAVIAPPQTEPTAPIASSARPAFSREQLASFRAEDRLAATAIVCILSSILLIGLVLYTAIAIWVW
jgi:hypothetical protein